MTVAQIVALAAEAGIEIKPALVYNVRAQKGSKAGDKAAAQATVAPTQAVAKVAEASDVESLLGSSILRIGLDRADQLFEALQAPYLPSKPGRKPSQPPPAGPLENQFRLSVLRIGFDRAKDLLGRVRGISLTEPSRPQLAEVAGAS